MNQGDTRMIKDPLYSNSMYLKKIINSLLPRTIHAFSPFRFSERNHWREQNTGMVHGYDKYIAEHDRIPILIHEMERLIDRNDPVLDIGCNCGYYLNEIKKAGFIRLTGIDISPAAIEYGRKTFGFSADELIDGSFEELLPKFISSGRLFSLTYSMGATLELVHPSFDIIRAICDITERYVLLIIAEWGHRYPRFYEYKFNRQGFLLVKALRPYNGNRLTLPPEQVNSFLLFERYKNRK
jgi:SAM-dependent methyltransferase